MPDQTKATLELPVHAPALTWFAVHGTLCLGLRHPMHTGASRAMVVDFVHHLGRYLVANGFLTEAELQKAERIERQESPHGRRR